MVNRQVITFGSDGSVSGLQRKPGQGIDLRQFGRAEIDRASLVEWDEERQKWYIDVLQEHGRGIVTLKAFQRAQGLDGADFATTLVIDDIVGGPKKWSATSWARDGEGVLMFTEYDDAVKVEIAYLDALRLKGEF